MRRFALAAAGAALIGLTACSSHSATPGAGDATQGRGTSVAPVSCSKQYRAWTSGHGKGVMRALDGVSSAARAQDDRVLTAALMQAKPAVAKAARHPIPACADPRGYWTVLLMHVHAAAASKGSSSSARAAMRGVPKLMDQLAAGVKKTAR
jgi:hypothetical protein